MTQARRSPVAVAGSDCLYAAWVTTASSTDPDASPTAKAKPSSAQPVMPPSMSFTGRPHDRAWAKHLLSEVGLSDRLNYNPEKLSVGQQQRVAVARALANRPRLVLADEPTGALDARNSRQALELIRRLCTEAGASLLLVTHDLEIAKQFPRVLSMAELNRPVTTGH